MARSNDRSFNPADFEFQWTQDGTQYGWYEWDREAAHKAAKRERDAAARAARKQGFEAKCWSNSGQLITRGGIGSGRPEIEMVVTVFHVTISEPEPSLINGWGRMLYGA